MANATCHFLTTVARKTTGKTQATIDLAKGAGLTSELSDCVDTKPIDGNIFDMFIGPINPDIDNDGEGVP